jgi:hypothetical protein
LGGGAEALLERYAKMVPEDLEDLASEERHAIYKMLRLRVVVFADKPVEVTGVFGGPLGAEATRSAKTEVSSMSAPKVHRTPELRFRVMLLGNGAEQLELAALQT